MRIYTRTGDKGETGLFGGERVSKADPRVDAYGHVDELNSVLGWAITQVQEPELNEGLRKIQGDLLSIGAHLATPKKARASLRARLPAPPVERITEMEAWIDRADEELPPLESFILPGGSAGGAALHVARCVCRRAERAVVGLPPEDAVDPELVRYLNRLSDLLFTLARLVNFRSQQPEQPWLPPTS